MALAAQLYQDDDREAERFRVGLDATLRDPSHAPLDVVVEDLSAGGVRVITTSDLPLDVEIGLGLAGIGTRRAHIIWRDGDAYGCEFVIPLTGTDLNTALSAPSTAPVALPTPAPWGLPVAEAEQDDERKLSPRARLFAIIACAIAAWVVTILLGSAVVRMLGAL